MCPCNGPNCFPGNFYRIGTERLGRHFDPWWLEVHTRSNCLGSASCWCIPCLVDFSTSVTWWGASPLPVVFCIVGGALEFASVVFLVPPLLFSILVFVSHSTFCLIQHPGWDIHDVGWISLSGLPVGGVLFIRWFLGVICYIFFHSY